MLDLNAKYQLLISDNQYAEIQVCDAEVPAINSFYKTDGR